MSSSHEAWVAQSVWEAAESSDPQALQTLQTDEPVLQGCATDGAADVIRYEETQPLSRVVLGGHW